MLTSQRSPKAGNHHHTGTALEEQSPAPLHLQPDTNCRDATKDEQVAVGGRGGAEHRR